MNKGNGRGFGFYIVLLAIFALSILLWKGMWEDSEDYITNSEFESYLKNGDITDVVIQPNAEIPTGVLRITLKSGVQKILYVSNVSDVEDVLQKDFPNYELRDVTRESWFVNYMLPILLVLAVVIIVFAYMNNQAGAGGGNSKVMNFGKSRAKLSTDDNKMTFKEVAGLDEEKDELKEIVDFLKTPQKYIKVGARIPKGVLLVGPPDRKSVV